MIGAVQIKFYPKPIITQSPWLTSADTVQCQTNWLRWKSSILKVVFEMDYKNDLFQLINVPKLRLQAEWEKFPWERKSLHNSKLGVFHQTKLFLLLEADNQNVYIKTENEHNNGPLTSVHVFVPFCPWQETPPLTIPLIRRWNCRRGRGGYFCHLNEGADKATFGFVPCRMNFLLFSPSAAWQMLFRPGEHRDEQSRSSQGYMHNCPWLSSIDCCSENSSG